MRTHMLGATPPSRGWCKRFVSPVKKSITTAKVRERGSAAVMAYFPTWKGGLRMERMRRYGHLDLAVLLEADPSVTRWTTDTQPEHVEHDDGEVRVISHTFRVETWHGIRLITLSDNVNSRQEVKQPHELPVDDLELRYESLSQNDLIANPRLQTSKDILFHRPRLWPRELPHRVAAMAALENPATLGDLHQRLSLSQVAFEDVVSLVAQGFIDVDLDFDLGPEMPVRACRAAGHLG